MKAWIGVVAVAGVLANGSAMAANGNDLLKWCQGVDSDNAKVQSGFGAGYCIGTMSTVNTLVNYINSGLSLEMCPPPEITNGQMAKIVIKYLQQNPEVLHLEATALTVSALRTAYPCKK
jgi:hypothetical protein